MTDKLTVKEDKFCNLVVELGNQAEAYRQVFKSKSSPQVCAVEASKLVAKPKIALRLKELRENIAMKHEVTVDSLINELEEARTIALTCETPQSSAAISATMGKAKLCGLDKQIIDHTSSDGSMTPTKIILCGPDDDS